MSTPAYRSLYTHAWDIRNSVVNAFVDEVPAMGIRDATLASASRSTRFTSPRYTPPSQLPVSI